ncbi:MAG: hypothetical protein ICV64_07160 [Thermoleophilia bacterium]|nr:hypothetical protein [Thermoleophilia bacterium]
MRVEELAPGLWCWTALHPEWTPEIGRADGWDQEVSCVYYESPEAVILIDPLVPPEDEQRFWHALDRDLARAARPLHVLITILWHARSTPEIVARYPRTRVWVHEPAAEAIAHRTPYTDRFRAGDALPGPVLSFDAHRAWEVLFWLPEHRTLVAGDLLTGTGDGLRVRDEWLGHVHPRELRETLRAELDLPIERVLVAHGPPVLAGGRADVDAALE